MRETLDVELVLKTAIQEMRQVMELAEVEIRLSPEIKELETTARTESRPGSNGRKEGYTK